MPASIGPNRIPSAALAAGLLLVVCAVARAEPRTRATFIQRNACEVAARLDAIHRRGPITTSRNRFIVLSLRGQEQHYVQCIFEDRDTRMFCEASSGAYGSGDLPRLRLTPSAVVALHALGYRQESPDENYARELSLGSPPDVGIAAELMLGALYDAYGARLDSAIEITAPYGGPAGARCGTPTS